MKAINIDRLTLRHLLDAADDLSSAPDLAPIHRRELLRKAAGFTQSDLAACVGASWLSLRNWERGFTTPRDDHAQRYARILARCQEWVNEGLTQWPA